jgi:endonuclease III
MIGIRLPEDYERKLRHLAREAKMTPGPFARRILIAYIESQQNNDAVVTSKLARIEQVLPQLARSMLRLEHKVSTFLDQVEITDPT